jgi:hypothetical protein
MMCQQGSAGHSLRRGHGTQIEQLGQVLNFQPNYRLDSRFLNTEGRLCDVLGNFVDIPETREF